MAINTITKYIKKHPQSRVIASVLAFIFIGTLLLAFSRAATPTASIEAENVNNLVAGCASKNSGVTNASAGGAVKFGCSVENDLVIISPKAELDSIKQAVTTGNKKAYWDYIKTQKAARAGGGSTTPLIPTDWSQNVTYTSFTGTYTFNPKTFVATDHPTADSATTQGIYMITGAINAYTCGLRWYFDQSPEATACGDYAVNYLDSWASNFQYAQCRASGIDGRENQVKLNSGWYIATLTKAIEVIWDHPSFTTEKKQKVADFLWKAFLLEDADLSEADGEVLGTRGAGWNGRTLMLQARLNAGLVMKAAGNSNGSLVINDVVVKSADILPEILYYGKEPWHEALGMPWPKQPYRKNGTTWGGYNTASVVKGYWFFTDSAPQPPPFFVGQTQETGRDVGHQQNGVGSITEVFRALRLNGYQDRFIQSDLGSILLQMGERHAKIYNEALDEYWGGGYASVDSLTCNWLPSEWNSLQLSTKSTNCPEISFKIGGASADFGWEHLRNELKLKGYSTPELDRLTSRLRGTGTKSSTNAAGVGYVRTTNHQAWEPLFGN